MPNFSSRLLRALLLVPLAGAAQTPPASFGAVATYSTGSNSTGSNQPVGIAVADINGDNKPDLITAHFSSSTVEVLLGTGAGGFGSITTFSAGSSSNPDDLAVADVNGDGKLDIVTANGSGLGAGVLLGTGTGSFGPATIFSTSTSNGANRITVADVNGDGKPDILTTDTDAANSTAKVLLGTGTGSFGPPMIFSLGTSSIPVDIVVADVNGDSKPDILTANNLIGTVGVLLGTGTGTFGTMAAFSVGTGSRPNGLSVADVNGDGKPDVLTANGNTGTVAVLLGTGTGGFGTANTYFISGSGVPYAVAVADVNGDGKPDLLTANYGANTAGVLLGTSTGSFGAVTTFNTGSNSQPAAIAVADVNGDRRPDLLTANTGTNTLGVLLNTGTYPLASPAALAAEIGEAYPNPAHDHLQLKLPAGAVQATLLDALGQVVRQQTGAGPGLTLETAGLAAGVYVLRLQAGGATLARRVVLD